MATPAPQPLDPTKESAQPDLPELQPLRAKIDALDADLVRLLNERAKVVLEVGKVKRAQGGAIYVPSREKAVLDKVKALSQGPLPGRCLEAIWRELMSGSFALEHPLRIGFLGPPGSYSHLAAERKFGSCVEYDGVQSIEHIFDAVARGHNDYGLVPVENSTEGSVAATLDQFIRNPLRVCAEVLAGIHHNLIANCDAPDIKRIYSHPQALAQCGRWLSAQFPKAERIAASSTSRAVEIAVKEEGSAAIGSLLAAQLYGGHVQFERIEDNPNNTTRFFVLGRQKTQPTGDDKTAVLFATEHKPGALVDVLGVFQKHGLNLTHIDKRPSQRVNWEYCFFVDFQGHEDDAKVKAVLAEAKRHCIQLEVLGSFPRAVEAVG